MKILIVIPAYNEAENIENVMKNINKYASCHRYIIVNDGSSDCTINTCKQGCFSYLDLPINLGLEAAIQTGMQYASKQGYDGVLQFDGDGQHNAKYISVLCDSMDAHNADIVIGSRFLKEDKPFSLRMAGASLLQLLIKVTTGTKLTDPTSGMRLFNKKMIEKFAWGMNYGPEPDTLVYLMRSGAKVVEVPVTMHERVAGESYLNFANSMRYMLRMCISILVVQWFRKK
ncbi:MAG: glycosyltransferase family 2 protein [Defluviitaleaceae bacterium]|nr:glycosyltransferase family 2 protein [Defluviitaleaceae bacterium]